MKKVVILAAGKGRRMGSDLPKVLVPLKGKPMIEYLIQSIVKSGVDKKPIIVVSLDNVDFFKKALSDYDCIYAIQKEQLGTGHALSCAASLIKEDTSHVICFNGDHPFIRAESIKKLAEEHNGPITIMTTAVKDFKGWHKSFYHWGRIVRDRAHIKEIIEFKDADEKTKKIREVNPALYCFEGKWLWQNINKLKNNNAQEEYYLTDLIKFAFEQDLDIQSFPLDSEEAIGINTPEELKIAEELLKKD